MSIMKKKNVIIVAMLSFLLFSCSQDDILHEYSVEESHYGTVLNVKEEMDFDELNDEEASDIIKFTYKGKTYTSKCIYGESFQIEDEIIQKIFNELSSIPNIAIRINSDLSIDFYDSIEELNSSNRLKKMSFTRSITTDRLYLRNFKIRLWDRAKGRKKGGRCLDFFTYEHGNVSPETLRVPQSFLIKENFDNIISSCQIWGEYVDSGAPMPTVGVLPGQKKSALITFYDGNYTGKTLTFDKDLSVTKHYSERDYFSGFGFDNITSSIVVTYY